MKTWSNCEIVELNIKATAEEPTTEMSADLYLDGYFKQGTRTGSGKKEDIPYYPA